MNNTNIRFIEQSNHYKNKKNIKYLNLVYVHFV